MTASLGDRPRSPWPVLGLAFAAVACYLPAVGGGFIWDDDGLINNPHLRSGEGLRRIWTDPLAHPLEEHWWPLLYTTFWIEYRIWGAAPLGYHVVNLLLHAGNSLLVWLILRRLAAPGAWPAAAIFALHPIHVESVAWVIERKDVLSGLFYLLAVLAYLRFDTRRRPSDYAAALAATACAMLTKSVASTLPIALALCLWRTRGRLTWRDARALAPFVLLVAGLEYLSLNVMGGPQPLHDAELESVPAFAASRWLSAGRALAFYAWKVLWPSNLMPIYPRWPLTPPPAAAWLCSGLMLALLAAAWAARRRIGRGPLIAGLFFAVTLAPTLGLVNFGHLRYAWVADRFVYLASIGPIALLAGAGARVAERLGTHRARLLRLGAGAWCAVLGALTWIQSGIYRDQETFWRFAIMNNPNAWAAHHNLGVALSNQGGRTDQALESLGRGLALKPDDPEIRNTLGITLAKAGRYDEAERWFNEAAALDPNYADPHYNLGYMYIQQGRSDAAVPSLRRAVGLSPRMINAHLQLAFALLQIGDMDSAIDHAAEARRLSPGQPDAPFALGLALLRAGRPAEAVEPLAAALQLRPQWLDARCELGVALLRGGRAQEGLALVEQVLRADPGHPRAREVLEDRRRFGKSTTQPGSGSAPAEP